MCVCVCGRANSRFFSSKHRGFLIEHPIETLMHLINGTELGSHTAPA